ncbi:MAG: hypothetical protein ACRC6K_07465 [Fusobacteriaceae bacterium]
MLKSSILVLLLLSIYFNEIKIISIVFLLNFIINLVYNKDILKNLKSLKIFIFFYISTFIFQFIFNQEGEVFFKIFGIYITREGVNQFLLSFLRIINLLMLSWLASYSKIFGKGFGKYQRVIENVILLIPQVINLFKKKMKLKWFFRYILKQIKVKI